MLGGAIKRPSATEPVIVKHTEQVIAGVGGKLPLPKDHLTDVTLVPKAWTGHPIRFINLGGGVVPANETSSAGARTQITDNNGTAVSMQSDIYLKFKNPALLGSDDLVNVHEGDVIRIFWDEKIDDPDGVTLTNATESAVEVTISPSTFPGTYRVVGDTFMRDENGTDVPFQFIIEKAKVQSEVTITLEAEGDPSTNVILKSQNSNVEVKTCELREHPESFNYQTMAAMCIAA